MAVSDQRVAPLTFGQLSVWRDVEDLPADRAHEANVADVWTVPSDVPVHRIVTAFEGLTQRHEGLRIRYDVGPHGLRMILPDRVDGAPVQVLREDAERTLEAVVDAELSTAVNLSIGPGWRAAVVAGPESTAVVVLSHHITTDAWATKLIRKDFHCLLAEPQQALDPVPGLLDWAQEQRAATEQRLRQRAKVLAYFEKIVAADEALAAVKEDEQSPAVQATLLSCELRDAAAQIAAAARTSIGSVVLAAAIRAFAGHLGVDRLAVDIMASNRTSKLSRLLLTSMNQWAPALFERLASYPLTEAAVIVQHTTLDASRHGEYDVDELRQLRHDVLGSTAKASALAVNFVPEPPMSPVNTAGDRERVMITRPFTVLYAQPCYIKIYDQNPDLLIWITSRLAGDAGTAVKIMMSLRDDLTTAATR